MCEKNSPGSSSKHQDKPHSDRGSKDKESSKTPQKHVVSPSKMPPSTEWAEKEPCLREPYLTFNASSQSQHCSPSRHLSETDDQASFVGPNSTSTSNKTEGGPCVRSISSTSRHSMTPFEIGLGGSFSIPSYAGVCCSSINPVTSVAGSQQVTSSGWHQSASFSPLTPQVTDTLSTEQATEVYQLTADCQVLGSKLAKQFQTLSRLEVMHCTVAWAKAHESVLYRVAMTIQNVEEWESTLHGLCAKANKAWKDANDVIFSHLLRYDYQLVGFITSAEGTLQDKCEEIWRCIHSLAETTNISPQTSLALALQILDWLPTTPWDLSYHAGIPMMFAYGPELYELQSWSTAEDANYLLDSHTQDANLLSHKWCTCVMEQALMTPAPAEQLH